MEKKDKIIIVVKIMIGVLAVFTVLVISFLIYNLVNDKKENENVKKSSNRSDYSFWLKTPQDYEVNEKESVDTVVDTESVIEFQISGSN